MAKPPITLGLNPADEWSKRPNEYVIVEVKSAKAFLENLKKIRDLYERSRIIGLKGRPRVDDPAFEKTEKEFRSTFVEISDENERLVSRIINAREYMDLFKAN